MSKAVVSFDLDNADYVAYSVDELRSILFALLGSGRWKAEANMEY